MIAIEELEKMTVEELRSYVEEQQECLAVLDGMEKERMGKIQEHTREIRRLQDLNFGDIPKRAETHTNLFTIHALLKVRVGSLREDEA